MSTGLISSYEVLRPFGGPGRDYQPGERIPVESIRPENAISLVERRFLLPIGILAEEGDGAERKAWRRRLQPYLAIASIGDAPAESQLAQTVARAAALAETASTLEQRRAALQAQRDHARAIVDGADERADFPNVAAALAEVTTLDRLLETQDAETALARVLADEAQREAERVWAAFTGSREWLAQQLDGRLPELALAQRQARWSRAWITLTGWIGDLGPVASGGE